ncbi:MAG: rhodanese-like domain-containing protein [Pirellulaceae bacterium]
MQIEESAIKLSSETLAGDYPLISTKELKTLVDGKKPMLIVDAMPAAASYDKGHIPSAVNFEFPKEVITTWDDTTMPGQSQSDYELLLGEDKNRLIIVYCGFVKCARSHNAAVFAKQLGYNNVKRHPGGIYAWRGAGYPVSTK